MQSPFPLERISTKTEKAHKRCWKVPSWCGNRHSTIGWHKFSWNDSLSSIKASRITSKKFISTAKKIKSSCFVSWQRQRSLQRRVISHVVVLCWTLLPRSLLVPGVNDIKYLCLLYKRGCALCEQRLRFHFTDTYLLFRSSLVYCEIYRARWMMQNRLILDPRWCLFFLALPTFFAELREFRLSLWFFLKKIQLSNGRKLLIGAFC